MKNKVYLIAAATCGALLSNVAQADESVTVDMSFSSDYVFRGIKLGEASVSPSVEVAVDDFYIGVWGALSQANKGWPNNFEDEYDFYVGQSYALNEDVIVDGGITFYTYEDADETVEAYLGASREYNGITGSVYGYYDFDLETATLELSASHTYALTDAINLDLGVYLGTVMGGEYSYTQGATEVSGDDDYSYYGADVVIPFEVSDSLTVSAGFHYADHDSDAPHIATDNAGNQTPHLKEDSLTFFSLSATYGF